MSVEELINQALVDIGYVDRIASVNEGSRASIAALEIYGQTRDELLGAGEWPLARRANISLTLLKGPPPAGGYNPLTPWTAQYPPLGWLYQYAYPADMIDMGAIIDPQRPLFDLDPVSTLWRVDNDNSLIDRDGVATVQQKVILTNTKTALAVYIGQVTDPNLFEPGFIAVLIKRLGEKLSRALGMGEAVEREEVAEAGAEMAVAGQSRG